MIGRAASGVWCDYCKDAWGQVKGEWHLKAKTPAWIAIKSERPLAKGITRNYCAEHAQALTIDANGNPFPFEEQTSYIRDRIEVAHV